MTMKSTPKSKRTLTLILILVIAALGVGGYWYYSQFTQSGEERVFYVVAYHWGFAIYDENFNEINRIEVNRGDIVTLYVIPGAAFSEDAHEEYEHRTLEAGIGNLPPESEELHSKLKEAEDKGYMDHGLGIESYSVNVRTSYQMFRGSADSLKDIISNESSDVIQAHSYTFKVNKAGSFDIFCTVYCGYGHEWMELKNAFVVRG